MIAREVHLFGTFSTTRHPSSGPPIRDLRGGATEQTLTEPSIRMQGKSSFELYKLWKSQWRVGPTQRGFRCVGS